MSFKEKTEDTVSASSGKAVGLPTPPSPAFKPAETWGEIISAWPKSTFCIFISEFCKRFSYYGMRAMLILYLLNVLKFDDNASTVFFNSFTVLCYATPLLGCILADGYIGKFKTIAFVSLIYAAGQSLLAISSKQRATSTLHPMLDMAGLLIIAIGTGGIEPCLSAFGGDQFELGQERMLSIYFSMFYFSITAAGLISTFISPIYRTQSCMEQDTDICYPLGFGVSAVLIVVATIVFLAGSFWYKKRSPNENIIGEVLRTTMQAILNWWSSNVKRDHWLDHCLDSHMCKHDEKCLVLRRAGEKNSCHKREIISGVRNLFRLIVMFLLVPIFWVFYNQQVSRWLIQAMAMNYKLWGNVLLLPDQMQTLNAVLILLFIPIFQIIIYPLVGKCVKITPLRKMVCGGLLACAAFVISAAVQLRVNTTLPDVPKEGQAFLSFANTFQNCSITITPPQELSSLGQIVLLPNTTLYDDKVSKVQQVLRVPSRRAYNWNITSNCGSFPWGVQSFNYSSPPLKSQESFYIVVGNYGAYMGQTVWRKPMEGNGEFSLSINLAMDLTSATNLALCRHEDNATDSNYPCNPKDDSNFYYWELDYNSGTTDLSSDASADNPDNKTISWVGGPSPSPPVFAYVYKPVKPGTWDLYYMKTRAKDVDQATPDRKDLPVNYTGISFEIERSGGVYALIVTKDGDEPVKTIYQIVPSADVSILWQVPQIALITAGEVLFAITGYEFAYSQAAPSMKSIGQALWLLTTFFGDLIIMKITPVQFSDNMAIELLVCAAAMFVVIIIFALLSIFYYEYSDYTKAKSDDDDRDISGADNTGFEEDVTDEKL